MLLKKLSITLIVIFTIIFQSVSVYAAEVFVGGQSIGIELKYDGVLITGTYDISIDNTKYNPSSDGYLSGDMIQKVNGTKIDSISVLMETVEKEIENKHKVILTLLRDQKELNKELKYQFKDGKFSTGLYVQEGLTGVGTMTYYDPSTQHFGALGHVMSDTSLSSQTVLNKGSIYHSYVKRIQPSSNGNPGEKIADIGSVEIGTIFDNNNYGVFGTYDQLPHNITQPIVTASIDEVKKGDAYFLTVLNGHEVEKCSIRITDLKKQKKPDIKGITFEITDKEVLSLTNGVVQGMSGSPIIQDGKLIGCVTHVNVNNVHQGYGLYIDWMIENDK